jgi:hypothetical protein
MNVNGWTLKTHPAFGEKYKKLMIISSMYDIFVMQKTNLLINVKSRKI